MNDKEKIRLIIDIVETEIPPGERRNGIVQKLEDLIRLKKPGRPKGSIKGRRSELDYIKIWLVIEALSQAAWNGEGTRDWFFLKIWQAYS